MSKMCVCVCVRLSLMAVVFCTCLVSSMSIPPPPPSPLLHSAVYRFAKIKKKEEEQVMSCGFLVLFSFEITVQQAMM